MYMKNMQNGKKLRKIRPSVNYGPTWKFVDPFFLY